MPQKISFNIVRTCKCCGREFHPTARKQFCCNAIVLRRCAVCGSEFEAKCNTSDKKVTCSRECQAEYTKLKRRQSSLSTTKVCKWCGKEFHPNSVRDVYCYEQHFQICEVCGDTFDIDPRRDPNVKTCSNACRYELARRNRDSISAQEHTKETLLQRYGVDNAMKIPGSVDKIIQTNRLKYGKDWYTQTQEYQHRVQKSSLENYGVPHFLMSEQVIEKRKQTLEAEYGVDNVFQLDEVKLKTRITLSELYGVEYISQSDEIQDRIRNTNIAKYGAPHPMMLDEFKDRVRSTNKKKYGREYYTQQHISRIQDWYLFINDPRSYIMNNYENYPRSAELAEDLGVDISTIDVYLSKFNSTDCVRRSKSLMEEQVSEIIFSMLPDVKLVSNDRLCINPLELDIYLPELHLAFECNPTVTHNSSVGDPWGGDAKSRNYHLMKTKKCEEEGIFLFHIFGSEWAYRRPIIQSMIRNLLGTCERKIYARKCEIREVDSNTCRNFLNTNHRQGNVNSKIRLGLYLEDELVSVMTFGKMRNSIGTDTTDLSDCWELVRFCSLLNTSVVGGASKLFTHFLRMYQPARVRSFSDRAHTKGNLYQKLGFNKIRESDPGYVWVDSRTDISYHRYSAQKQNIKKFLHDDDIDLSRTEKQIMEEHGFLQVFDCGTILWEWSN